LRKIYAAYIIRAMSENLATHEVDEATLFSGAHVRQLCIDMRNGSLSPERDLYEKMFELHNVSPQERYAHVVKTLGCLPGEDFAIAHGACVALLTSHDSDNGFLGAQLTAGIYRGYKNGPKAAAHIWDSAKAHALSLQGGYHADLRVKATHMQYSIMLRSDKPTPLLETYTGEMLDTWSLARQEPVDVSGEISHTMQHELGAVAARHNRLMAFNGTLAT
jgi:hypothetical protein